MKIPAMSPVPPERTVVVFTGGPEGAVDRWCRVRYTMIEEGWPLGRPGEEGVEEVVVESSVCYVTRVNHLRGRESLLVLAGDVTEINVEVPGEREWHSLDPLAPDPHPWVVVIVHHGATSILHGFGALR